MVSYKAKKRIYRFLLYLGMSVFGIVMVLPFYFMIITSFKKIEDVIAIPISLWFKKVPTIMPYKELLVGMPYLNFMWNSVIVSCSITFGTMFFCSIAGYAFAKHRFPGKEKIFISMLATMMIPGSVLLVPGFLLMRDFGWLNTYLPLIIPALSGTFGVFLAKQFIESIPDDLIDAAKIDGCPDFLIYTWIIVPLSKALLATLAILTFLGSWNSFIGPLIFLLDEERYTLPLGIALLQGRYTGAENIQMAGAALAIIPVLIIFFFFQKQIVKSLSTSGLKG
ncbi:MAG: carbohydrate ABC transporter permease [bacterium]